MLDLFLFANSFILGIDTLSVKCIGVLGASLLINTTDW